MVSKVKETPEVAIQALGVRDEAMFRFVAACKVVDKGTQQNAEDLLISARYAYKRADEKRRHCLEPIEEARNRVNDLFRPYLERLQG